MLLEFMERKVVEILLFLFMIDGVFERQKEIGREGEEIVLEYLRERHLVDDVRENKDFQKQDIDFIVDGVSLEIKTDNNISRTGNIYIETYRGGWYEKCKAEYLGVYSPQNRILYILNYPCLKSILPSFGRQIRHYDADTGLQVPATLLSLYYAETEGALTQTISL